MVIAVEFFFKYSFLFLLSSFCLISCQPIKYTSILPDHDAGLIDSTANKDSFREGVQYFTNNLSSNKLDLVLVLDTQKGMESFYKKNIFGSNFLDHFKEFDWRVAYTNTSITQSVFENPKDSENKKEQQPSCKGSEVVISFLTGILLEAPVFLFTGISTLSKCISSIRNRKKQKHIIPEANGDFLPFEHKNQRLQLTGNYLTREVEDYNRIFNDTMVFVGGNRNKYNYYDAPIIQGESSYPFLSILFSMANQINEQALNKFFREDSRIVYVVITPEDRKINMEEDHFEKALKNSFQGKNRFQLIPVTIKPKDTFFCKVKFQAMGLKKAIPAVELQKISERLGTQSLDICSSNLGEELAEEIKTYLHSMDVL